jgi:membrane-associated phospholipid phosphatase
VFHTVNDLPERAFPALWGPMQYGAIGSVPVSAIGALVVRRPRLAVGLAAAGTAAWFLAKAVKPLVRRGRPASTVEGAVLRGRDEDDRGFPSGHAAVSAALTTVMLPYVPTGWKPLPAALATVVPFARVYVGAHLPLDVAGGSAMGIAIGSAINLALGVPREAR